MAVFIWFLFSVLPAFGAGRGADDSICRYYQELNHKLSQKGPDQSTGCGGKGYLLGFGHYYCKEYARTDYRYSVDGRRRLKAIRECLVKVLRENERGLSCQNVAKFGIASHYGCYLESGFCNLSYADAMNVYWTAKAAVSMPSAWNTFGQVKIGCTMGRGGDAVQMPGGGGW